MPNDDKLKKEHGMNAIEQIENEFNLQFILYSSIQAEEVVKSIREVCARFVRT